jgi:hypothetical protein
VLRYQTAFEAAVTAGAHQFFEKLIILLLKVTYRPHRSLAPHHVGASSELRPHSIGTDYHTWSLSPTWKLRASCGVSRTCMIPISESKVSNPCS